MRGWAGSEKVRAQPIGISAAPNMTGQARGEGGKDGRPLSQSATAFFVPLAGGGAATTRQQNFANSDHESVKSRKPRNASPRQMLQQR
jgi:hypothetical protein